MEETMKAARYSTMLFVLLILLTAPNFCFATPTEKGDVESYGEINRDKVVRIRSVDGDVVLKTGPQGEWVRAQEYMILTGGYTIVTGPGGFAEIEIDPGRYVRMQDNTEIFLSEASSQSVIFRYTSGGVYVTALERHARRIEFDLGSMRSVNLYGEGAYRIDDEPRGVKTVMVREGRVWVEHESGKLDVFEGNMAVMDGNVVLETAYGRDGWDDFAEKRDNEILSLAGEPPIYEEIPRRYEWYGYSEWVAYPSYGYFFWPHFSLLFYGHHGHHLHSGIHIGVGHRHLHTRHFRRGLHLHKRRHLHGTRIHRGGLHRNGHIRPRHRDVRERRIFHRGTERHRMHISPGNRHNGRIHSPRHRQPRRGDRHLKRGISHRNGTDFRKRGGISRSRIFSRGSSRSGGSFRRGGRMGRSGFRSGGGRR
jgi:uncharacterized membrane protein YgcG